MISDHGANILREVKCKYNIYSGVYCIIYTQYSGNTTVDFEQVNTSRLLILLMNANEYLNNYLDITFSLETVPD